MEKNKAFLWVHPDFKKKLKQEAALKETSMLSYTESLARVDENLEELLFDKRKGGRKKDVFPFRF